MNFKNTFGKRELPILILYCILLYFAVFHQLERVAIHSWDESLFSLRAVYMHLHGEYMYNFNFFPDMIGHQNTKLPFTTFFQVLTLKIFGINELAIRLPIGLIYIFTVFYVLFHFKKRFETPWAGYVFGLVGITTIGFVEPHLLRSGDQDAPYACYLVLATIAFIDYTETRKTKSLLVFTFFSLAALLTKNLLCGLLVPGLLLFTILTRQLIPTLKDYRFWLAGFTIVGLYAGLIYYYELQQPGFFDRMWNYELFGRYTKTIEGHSFPAYYYFEYLAFEKMIPYIFMVPIIFLLAFKKDQSPTLKNSILGVGSVMICYLFFLSFSQTKTTWYVAPAYPLGAYLVALGSVPFFNYLKKQPRRDIIVILGGIFIVWASLYAKVVSKNLTAEPILKDERYGWFMRKVSNEHPQYKKYAIVENSFASSAIFYREQYNREKEGFNISLLREIVYEENQIIMSCRNQIIKETKERYNVQVMQEWESCQLMKVISKK